VVQSYKGGVGWLTEGIADYVRYFKYEPKPTPPKITRRPATRTATKTSATFLAWLEKSKDKEIVRKLNELLRTGKVQGGPSSRNGRARPRGAVEGVPGLTRIGG